MLKILHLSDLHLHSSIEHDQQIVLDAFFEDIKQEASTGPIDLIFFTGDLTAKGHYEQDNKKTFAYIKEKFLDPLSKASQVPIERIFITPGNHDVNQSKADPILSLVYANLKRHDDVNELMATVNSRKHFWTQLSDFNESLDFYGGAVPIFKNDLFRSYIVEINNKKIGIACINSAWRASGRGNDEDYGKLLVGERQIEDLYESIKEADLHFGLIHHPLNWLTTYDMPPVQRAIYRKFDALLHGHNHYSDVASLVSTAGSLFIGNAGCLYQSREYFNGYSIIILKEDNAQLEWEVCIREYFEHRQQFAISSRFSEGGKKSVFIPKMSGSYLPVPTAAYTEVVTEKLNSKLLSYSVSDVAPKSLHGIFVEPPLSHLSEHNFNQAKGNDLAATYLALRDLANNPMALFFLGRKEAGKTTLLTYLCTKANDPTYLSQATHGTYVDVSSVPRATRATLLDSMVSFCGGEYKRADLITLLQEGRMIICFDNFPLHDKAVSALIAEFVKEFSKCKFCFAAEEGIEAALTADFIPVIGVNAEVVFMHSFSRKHTRELVSKWLPENPEAIQAQVNSILGSMKMLGVPQTPFLLSIFLWIKEKNINFTPINHASIIDTFVDGLLEKLSESKDRSNTDSTIKRHFLTELAFTMHESGNVRWTQNELEVFTVNYFANKALSSSTQPFLEVMFKKGILLDLDGEVCFKFDCFRSFFLAQKMKSSEDFARYAMTGAGFLELQTEIDYFTGLVRDRKEFLTTAISIVDDLRRGMGGSQVDMELFAGIGVENSILINNAKEDLIGKLFGKKPTIAEQEEMLERMEENQYVPDVVQEHHNAITQINIEESPESISTFTQYFEALKLASAILRNSELVDDAQLKHEAFHHLIGLWSEVLLLMLLTVEDSAEVQEKKLQELFPTVSPALAKYVAKLALPNVIFLTLLESLGSPKLQMIIDKHAKEAKEPVNKMLSTFLYADLQLPDYLTHIKALREGHESNRFLLELIFFKLLHFFVFKNPSEADAKRIAEAASSVYIKLNDQGSKMRNDLVRDRFLDKLKKKEYFTAVKSGGKTPSDE